MSFKCQSYIFVGPKLCYHCLYISEQVMVLTTSMGSVKWKVRHDFFVLHLSKGKKGVLQNSLCPSAWLAGLCRHCNSSVTELIHTISSSMEQSWPVSLWWHDHCPMGPFQAFPSGTQIFADIVTPQVLAWFAPYQVLWDQAHRCARAWSLAHWALLEIL